MGRQKELGSFFRFRADLECKGAEVKKRGGKLSRFLSCETDVLENRSISIGYMVSSILRKLIYINRLAKKDSRTDPLAYPIRPQLRHRALFILDSLILKGFF